MAAPIEFGWQNAVLVGPPGSKGVGDLPVHRGAHGIVTSAWRLTSDELQEVVASGGVVYLSVFSGFTQPPVYVGDERTVLDMVAAAIENYGLEPKEKN